MDLFRPHNARRGSKPTMGLESGDDALSLESADAATPAITGAFEARPVPDVVSVNSGTATMTVMFTDIADYTASVARSDREGVRRILAEHEAAVRPLVESFGGRVVKNIGDSFLCLFSSATDALRASLAIQKVDPTQYALTMRIALTTGDVEIIDGDAFGDSVNLAARILAQVPPGEIWFGAGTRTCMNAAEIAWETVGRFRLKGVPGEQECFRVVPENRVWLPHAIVTAAEEDKLVRIRHGKPQPPLPPDPTILFEGFEPRSPDLSDAMDTLPVLDPASLFLAAYRIAPEDRQEWTEFASGLVIGQPEAIDAAISDIVEPLHGTGEIHVLDGADTILLDRIVHTDLELVLCGLALPAVPLSDVVAAYSYELLLDGHWVTRSDRALLRVEVTPNKVTVFPLRSDISIGGSIVPTGEPIELQSAVDIATSAGTVEYCPIKSGYIGAMLLDTPMKLVVRNGQTAEFGRKPTPPALPFRIGKDTKISGGAPVSAPPVLGAMISRWTAYSPVGIKRRSSLLGVPSSSIRCTKSAPRTCFAMGASGGQSIRFASASAT